MPQRKRFSRDVFFMLAFLILALVIVVFASFQGTDVAKLQGAVINTSIKHTLQVRTIGNGTVVSDPVGINCGSTCKTTFLKGTVVNLTATPSEGYQFDRWTGHCSGAGSCSVTMNYSRTVIARFRTIPVLKINKSGTGTGVVTSNPAGITCGDTCKFPFEYSSTVTLLAIPETGSAFSYWSGCSPAKSLTCTVKMSTSRTVLARFNKTNIVVPVVPAINTLNILKSGSGTVTGAGIDCGNDCTEQYGSTTTVELTAAPLQGYKFGSWAGACSGAQLKCSVLMDSNKQVVANFSPENVSAGSLNISAVPSPTTPSAGQLVMGSSDNTFLVLAFSAGTESVNISRLAITDNSIFGNDLRNVKIFSVGTGASAPAQVGATVAQFNNGVNGQAVFNLTTPWLVPANATYYLVVKAGINSYPNAISGGNHVLKILSSADIDSYGVSSGSSINETGLPASSEIQYTYRTKMTVGKNASSPSGAAVAGTNQQILRLDVSTNANYSGILQSIGLNLTGNVDITGNGDTTLYNANGLEVLKTEKSKQTFCYEKTGNILTVGDTTGIPVGSNIVIYGITREVKRVVAIEDMTHVTIDSSTSLGCSASSTSVYYYPLQPGSGKLYFGAMTRLRSNLTNTDNTADVVSINGFAVGDKVTFKGYNSDNQEVNIKATISGLTGNTIYFTESVTDRSLNSTIIADRLMNSSGFTVSKHASHAVAYEGVGAYGSIGSMTTAGTSVTYIVKGDTTGATTNETLKANISITDFIWSDSLSYMIDSYTNTFPISGGNLTY